MKETAIGNVRYRLIAERRDANWIAHAERIDTHDRFGIECSGTTEAEAIDRLAHWLEWQSEHTAALELQKESLEAVEAARVRLDEIRARKPE